ncbi:unnamed protein product [Euphydryas editha]|uniref:RNase H type-1 domain-containing protein n=1 Tax=Euphydryas editha TaxID=104508 RepID=A0AAU9UVU1_EUPED|nr:unnamed protein product [Euphydryas editha]
MKTCIKQIRKENRLVQFFWLKAHVGTPSNEWADELAKKAALRKKTAPDYEKFPNSYVRRQIREETLRLWQDRYNSSKTYSVTKIFLPDVKTACKLARKTTPTFVDTQILTGHGGSVSVSLVSPGLTLLLNGSTQKISFKCKKIYPLVQKSDDDSDGAVAKKR